MESTKIATMASKLFMLRYLKAALRSNPGEKHWLLALLPKESSLAPAAAVASHGGVRRPLCHILALFFFSSASVVVLSGLLGLHTPSAVSAFSLRMSFIPFARPSVWPPVCTRQTPMAVSSRLAA